MRKVTIAAAVAAFFGLGATAQAADLNDVSYKDAPIAVSGPVWTGFYVGVGVGAASTQNDLSVGTDLVPVDVLGIDSVGGEGLFGTVQAGYDKLVNDRIVIGAFVDFDFGSTESEVDLLTANVLSFELENQWSVGARLGFLVNPNTLLYGLAAYTEASYKDSGLLADFVDIDDFSGYSVGAGLETNLRSNWFLKLEYRYTELESEKIVDVSTLVDADLEPSIHSARAVLTYKFGLRGRYETLK